MSDLAKLFDSYGRSARLYPAILVLTPLLVLPVVLIGSEKLSSYVVLGVATAALLYPVAAAIRSLGKNLEPKLFSAWGGMPTTRMLLWEDSTFDETSKLRYYAFFRAQGLHIPTQDAQKKDPDGARKKLASAIDCLRENRRDNRLVLGENANYGFRRNLLAAKWIGVGFACLAFLINLWPVYTLATRAIYSSIPEFLNRVEVEDIVGLVVDLGFLIFFCFTDPALGEAGRGDIRASPHPQLRSEVRWHEQRRLGGSGGRIRAFRRLVLPR